MEAALLRRPLWPFLTLMNLSVVVHAHDTCVAQKEVDFPFAGAVRPIERKCSSNAPDEGSAFFQRSHFQTQPFKNKKGDWEVILPERKNSETSVIHWLWDGMRGFFQGNSLITGTLPRKRRKAHGPGTLSGRGSTDVMLLHRSKSKLEETGSHNEQQKDEGLPPEYKPIPVLVYRHESRNDGANWTGNPISKAFGNDLLGDSLEPTNHGVGNKRITKEHGEEHADTHSYVALLFFIVCLMLGSIILHTLERHLPALPYTVALFIAGCFMGFTHEYANSAQGWACWWHSVEMWESIDPHMFFYGFLPSLIFGEAMRLNAQMVSECFWQILILACPGVIMGTVMTATFAVYVLPYGWDWPIALVFGSILSATDPVAVVALFNTLGVSPRLTMLISGESLLNDGTAMVIFSLMLKVTLGATLDFTSAVTFMTHMTVTSCLWGIVCGSISVFIIGLCAEEKQHSDLLIQIVVTMACGYQAFFVAESELSTSGILATVVSGFIIALNGWPRFVSRESMETLWETIEFIGNTIVFFIAGLLFVFNVMMRREYITFCDVGWLICLYIFMILSRAVMVLLLWPLMNLAGTPLDYKEALVMVWSGLRGAVGLAMAIIVDREPAVPTQMGSRVMFHIGGLAALTTIINATTSGPLLRFLDMTRTTEMKSRCLSMISLEIATDIRQKFTEKMAEHDDVRCQGASALLVTEMVPALTKTMPMRPDHQSPRTKDDSNASSKESSPRMAPPMTEVQKKAYLDSLAEIYRRTFLQVVKTHYWEAIEEGMLPKSGLAARVLLESVDEALGQTDLYLNDWQALEQKIDMEGLKKTPSMMSRLAEKWPFYLFKDFRTAFSRESKIELIVYVALTFMEVHCRAEREVPTFFPGAAVKGTEEDTLDKMAEQKVLQESRQQFAKAKELLAILPNTDVEVSRSKLFARELLQLQSNRLSFMHRKGFLTDMEVQSLEHEIHSAIRKVLRSRNREWLAIKARAEIREEMRPETSQTTEGVQM